MGARLWCARLTLTDFRSHAHLDLQLDARPVCLFGPNGAGKTNILEALTTLAPGRGLRSASAADLARADGPAGRGLLWAVSATIMADGEAIGLGAGAERSRETGARRIARAEGADATASDLARACRLAWATPAMDRLFSGPAGDRRRFFDRLTLARSPAHGRHAAAYERAMRDRQKLLEEGGDQSWIAALEAQMARHGAAVMQARAGMLATLQAAIAARPDGAFPKADLALEGPWAGAPEPEALSDMEAQLGEALRAGRRRDGAAGRALDGPHRTDLLVRHAAKNMPAELSSTGEQKALLLGILLAHARALADDAGAGPCLLLLDEAGAHLDPARRAALFDEVLALPGQTWLTGAEEGLFTAFGARAQQIAIGADGLSQLRD
jgi:DNA replication and repair protein RecF